MAGNGKKLYASGKKKSIKLKTRFSWKNFFLYSILVIFSLFVFSALTSSYEDKKIVPLSKVVSEVKKGNVTQITIAGDKLTITEKNGTTFQAVKEPGSNVYALFKDAGISLGDAMITVKDDTGLNNWINIASAVLPVALMIGFFYFIFRQARGTQEGIFSFGQSRAKLFNRDNPKVTFKDVAGVDEAKQELSEIVDFLKNPAKYTALGARTPKGVLMVGPAGTGKNLLERATAG